MRSRSYRPVDDDLDVWSIVCFYVYPTAKRQGVATALLEAAIDHALRHGAKAIEGYINERPDSMGVRRQFERVGFEPVRVAGKRTIMRVSESELR